MSIRVSKKHGVNPVIPLCFWCGKEKEEIALLGMLPGDKEAPKNAILNYKPCDSCQKSIDSGVWLIEAAIRPIKDDQPELVKGAYPTGRWCVVTIESAKEMFGEESNTVKDRGGLITEELWNKFI